MPDAGASFDQRLLSASLQVLGGQRGGCRAIAWRCQVFGGVLHELFGTDAGKEVQQWCKSEGWLLSWALGNPSPPPAHATTWTNDDYAPFNSRAVDPDVAAHLGQGTNITRVTKTTVQAFKSLWSYVHLQRNGTRSWRTGTRWRWPLILARGTPFAEEDSDSPLPPHVWHKLWSRLPRGLGSRALSGGDCDAHERCIGTWVGDADCICYSAATAA